MVIRIISKIEGNLRRRFCVGFICLLAAACSNTEQKTAAMPVAGKRVAATTTELATIAAGDRAATGNAAEHMKSPGKQDDYRIAFSENGRAVVYVVVRTDGEHVVLNGVSGRPYKDIGNVALSPDGQRVAYSVAKGEKRVVVLDGIEGQAYDGIGNQLVFSPDSRHIAYEARSGDRWQVVVDGASSPACVSYFEKPQFSMDSARIYLIENTDKLMQKKLVVSDLSFNRLFSKEFNARHTVLNEARSRLAAVSDNEKGQQWLTLLSIEKTKIGSREETHYSAINEPVFGPDGDDVAYAAVRDGKAFLVLNGKETPLPEGQVAGSPVIRPARMGAGILIAINGGIFMHHALASDGGNEPLYDEAADIAYSKNGSLYAYAARRGGNCFVVVNGSEGPAFDMVISPLFSPDGKLLVYRARKSGKRFVVVSDISGKVVRQHPEYDLVNPVEFTADGKSVAYGVRDGQKLVWKVEKL